MTVKNAELLKKSIAHYDRMIAWASKEEPSEHMSRSAMYNDIGECWTADHCALCGEYFIASAIERHHHCVWCPLNESAGKDGLSQNCNSPFSPWCKMDDARTWSDWVKAAKALRRILRKLYMQELCK